jgi:beta-galactosidase
MCSDAHAARRTCRPEQVFGGGEELEGHRGDSGVRIDAEAEHTVNEKNSFSVSYVYRVGRDGVLRVEYTVRPRVEFPWLPEIGMEFETAAGLDNLRWLGLGPLDAYPNEKDRAHSGRVRGRADSDTAKGTKATRWAELTSGQGAGVRVEGSPYIRLEGRNLRVLPSVVGRSEKGRRPEAPEYRLDTGASAVFQGGFIITKSPASAWRGPSPSGPGSDRCGC